ncbi:MAG: 30S ribosomal protein S17e [Candidatus Terraquivivens tikiterensis]|uniref:Small ribosomal subunit protein eS17 n=1 Tax=Candidatus Terraquivivens tikiterensis TaxID=1980982 RepID=A0A2R7Y157_9ARCH|nr:MAG: 30S ribosomal protein S17e [Candidatus Terraquivivens tikiterensis]
MGKVRTKKVKRLAKEVLELYRDRVSEDFEKNKQLVRQVFVSGVSKKLANRVAGYLTTLVKLQAKKEAELSMESAPAQADTVAEKPK